MQSELPAVLHRAIDLVPDFEKALETAIGLGFKRVLTSGVPRARRRKSVIRKLLEQAGNRIEVMAGAGLNPANVAQFVRTRACGLCTAPVARLSKIPTVLWWPLGFVSPMQRTTDAKVVTAMIESLNH